VTHFDRQYLINLSTMVQ